jgi:RecB family exonuclease
MAGGNKKIHEHPNAGKSTFRERPGDINRKGVPKKAYNSFIEKHKETTEMVNKKSIQEVVSILFNMTESELLEAAKDKEMPFTIRAVIQALLDPKSRQKELADWRDWLFGRAEQKVEVQADIISHTLKVEYTDD